MIDLPRVIQLEPRTVADRSVIGGKAASLVTLMNMGASVPPAFVLTTHAYRDWAADPDPEVIRQLVSEGIAGLEVRTGRRLGSGDGGLIVSVRSGAPVSMPGMMDTLLNAGMGPIAEGAAPFLFDARTRFLWQFSELALGLDAEWVARTKHDFEARVTHETLTVLEGVLRTKASDDGLVWPSSPIDELTRGAAVVFASWQSSRARLYRRMQKISDSLGTTVTIQQMVFGNRDSESGSGVAFTRNPTTGERPLTGEFLASGQGEEIVSGRETASNLAAWRARQPEPYRQLEELGRKLEAATKKVHEIEFTVESGRLYVLQCRPALMTARGAARVAVDMHDEQQITKEEAVRYAKEHGFDAIARQEERCAHPDAPVLATGLAVGGGVTAGRVALGSDTLAEISAEGDPAIFVATETSPNLLPLMQRSAALVTMRGGATSHAAVVAREFGKPCVVGVGGQIQGGRVLIGCGINEGEWITVDGDSGSLYVGDVTVRGERQSAEEVRLREWDRELSSTRPSTSRSARMRR